MSAASPSSGTQKSRRKLKYHLVLDENIPEPPSSQPRMRAPQRSTYHKVDDMITNGGFDSLGQLLKTLFYCPPRSSTGPDPRSASHISWVASLLQGSSNISIGDIIKLIYNHRESQPNGDSVYAYEADWAFSAHTDPSAIHHAGPSLSSWATQLVNKAVHREIGQLTQNDPEDPEDCTQLRAATNGQRGNVRVATWDDYGKFNLAEIGKKYERRAPLAWSLLQAMAAPRDGKGVVVIRQRRPHSNVSLALLSCSY